MLALDTFSWFRGQNTGARVACIAVTDLAELSGIPDFEFAWMVQDTPVSLRSLQCIFEYGTADADMARQVSALM
jgi:hypothetical protein